MSKRRSPASARLSLADRRRRAGRCWAKCSVLKFYTVNEYASSDNDTFPWPTYQYESQDWMGLRWPPWIETFGNYTWATVACSMSNRLPSYTVVSTLLEYSYHFSPDMTGGTPDANRAGRPIGMV